MGEKRRRRWPASPLCWGWLTCSVGAAVAGGSFLVYLFVFYSGGCRYPSTGWGRTRTFFCDDVLGRMIWPSLPWVVLVAMAIGILGGLVGGVVAAARAERRMPGVWLTSTALVYAGVCAVAALPPNGGQMASDVTFSVLPLTALISTGLLAAWVALTGGLWALLRAVQSRRGKRADRERHIDAATAP